MVWLANATIETKKTTPARAVQNEQGDKDALLRAMLHSSYQLPGMVPHGFR